TSSGDRLLALDRAVRDGGVPVRERDRDAEARFEGRLVEAREDAPRVGRLALGEGIAAAIGLRRIEAAEGLVERGSEAQPEGPPSPAGRGRARRGATVSSARCRLARALTSRPPTSAAAASIFRSAAWSVIVARPRSSRTVIRTSPENRPASRSGSRWRSYSVG